MISFEQRGFFRSRLFNEALHSYLDTLMPSLLKEYCLVSAKGGTGRGFEGKLAEAIYRSADMPYHIHILNGLLPALKLLEEKFTAEGWLDYKEASSIVRCFMVGFTFHDVNKLTGIQELDIAVEHRINLLCQKLDVGSFFSEWQDWIEAIKFLALGTEYRTRIHSLQKPIREFEFFNTVLAEYCHLADSIASMGGFSDVAEFYEQLCNSRLDGQKLSNLCPLSYVEVQENIYILLSQKLLFAARSIIQNERKQTILFRLRNGFVYIGEPLTKEEVEKVKDEFKGDLSDVVASSQVDFQTCKFGFLESLSEEPPEENRYVAQISNAMEKIIKAGYANSGMGSGKVKTLAISNYKEVLKVSQSKPEEIVILERLLDEYELPLKVIEKKNKQEKIENYFLAFNGKEWDDLESEHDFLKLLALEKIKWFSSKDFPDWQRWRKALSESERKLACEEWLIDDATATVKTLLPRFSSATASTIAALISAAETKLYVEKKGAELSKHIQRKFREISRKFARNAKTVNRKELDDFVEFYLAGNFKRDVELVLGLVEQVPPKDEMCLFTGRSGKIKYGSERAFGISALNFSNRSLNTLKSKDNQISSLFLAENDLRQKELPRGFFTKKLSKDDKVQLNRQTFLDSTEANSVIYYNFGEYFIDVLTQPMLNILGKAFTYDCVDVGNLAFVLDDRAYDYNLYGLNFGRIGNDVESNFYFIHQMLKLIRKTGFRIFTTSVLTPYHSHNELFVFENCLPFVKALGWDKTRIDQIDERLREMNLLLTLNAKKLVSNVLSYAEDKRFLFTAYAQLKDEDKPKAKGLLIDYVDSLASEEKEKLMSVMNNLAQIAIEMVRPKSGSTSQESWIIRDALKVLKDCHKEGRDKETTIEQIAGDLRKTLKAREYANLAMCEPFATAIYEQLFDQEWKRHFPQPNRLRNWVNQFAFLYSEKGWVEYRKAKIRSTIQALEKEQIEVSEDAVIERLITEKKGLEKYAEDFREAYKKVSSESTSSIN